MCSNTRHLYEHSRNLAVSNILLSKFLYMYQSMFQWQHSKPTCCPVSDSLPVELCTLWLRGCLVLLAHFGQTALSLLDCWPSTWNVLPLTLWGHRAICLILPTPLQSFLFSGHGIMTIRLQTFCLRHLAYRHLVYYHILYI